MMRNVGHQLLKLSAAFRSSIATSATTSAGRDMDAEDLLMPSERSSFISWLASRCVTGSLRS